MLIIKEFLYDFRCLLFPDLCCACGTHLIQGEKQICIACLYDLPYTDFHRHSENTVAKLFWGRINCQAAMAMFYFRKGTKVQNLIHALKYKSQTKLGFTLGRMLGDRLHEAENYRQADFIVPVPLHRKKERSRGYNQCKFIADGMAGRLQIPVNTGHLVRSQATETQTKKNRYNRFKNMRSVFQVKNPEMLAGKHIILVDDVITTGATLEACAQVLLDCGVAKISIVALAFAE